MKKKKTYRAYYKSPLGLLSIAANDTAITSLTFVKNKKGKENINEVVNDCLNQLSEYFKRERYDFNILTEQEGTDFQQKVWTEIQKIPYGITMSYLSMAKRLKNYTLSRAVGNACGKNKIPIIIPCHRLVGSNGDLIGYIGGLDRKKWLLEFENETVEPKLFNFINDGKKSRGKHS